MSHEFSVSLCKEQLTFSAAHFITLEGDICETLHGHNFGVRCEVRGALNAEGYVIDFIALRDELAKIVSGLDHRVLLPKRHPQIQVTAEKDEIVARFQQRRWVFPAGDCAVLPVSNTTAEELARYVAEQLIGSLRRRLGLLDAVDSISVGIDENQGQWADCTIDARRWDAADSND